MPGPDRPHRDISTHALREEGDRSRALARITSRLFLPTPSARRATEGSKEEFNQLVISTHALREEGDLAAITERVAAIISTHALREEGDLKLFQKSLARATISTHALREEGDVLQNTGLFHARSISTHALREEGDLQPGIDTGAANDFYPRPPRGGRPRQPVQGWAYLDISTHALREEGDSCHKP